MGNFSKVKYSFVFVFALIFATVFAWILCRDWFVFALALFTPYFMGGFRFLPYKSIGQKLVSIAFFMGFLSGICIFFVANPISQVR
jgi:hypothetical protein